RLRVLTPEELREPASQGQGDWSNRLRGKDRHVRRVADRGEFQDAIKYGSLAGVELARHKPLAVIVSSDDHVFGLEATKEFREDPVPCSIVDDRPDVVPVKDLREIFAP